MKVSSILLTVAVLGFSNVVVAAQQLRRSHPSKAPLPKGCSLHAMSSSERKQHQNRLERLSAAARLVREDRTGFTFMVDLKRMPLAELQAWAKNEQRCCSFLSMDEQVIERGKSARVRVTCPAEVKSSVIDTFGLR